MEHNENYYYNAPTPQQEFDRQASGVWVIASGLFTFIFIYLPLLEIGYAAATKFLNHTASGLSWIAATLAFAALAYGGVMLLKKALLYYRSQGKTIWILLFMFCVVLTCLLTPAIAYGPISRAYARWHWPHWLAWVTDGFIAAIIYVRYDFLDHFKQ